MIPVIAWTLFAVLTAFAVLALAGLTHPENRGVRQFIADLRSGLQRRDTADEAPVAEEDVAPPQDSSVEDLFTFGHDDRPAYVAPEELRVVHRVRQRTRRHPRQPVGR